MAGINLAEVLNTNAGVGRLWVLPLDKWDGSTKLETMDVPTIDAEGKISGNFDLVGKLLMDSVSASGDDMNIVSHKHTDGTNIITLAEDGTMALDFQSANIASAICQEVLNMDVAGTFTANKLGQALVYGKGDKIGYINPIAVYLEILNSPQWSGILFPYASLASKLTAAGNKTEIWTIDMTATAQTTPLKVIASDGQAHDYTSVYGESTYALIPKATLNAGGSGTGGE